MISLRMPLCRAASVRVMSTVSARMLFAGVGFPPPLTLPFQFEAGQQGGVVVLWSALLARRQQAFEPKLLGIKAEPLEPIARLLALGGGQRLARHGQRCCRRRARSVAMSATSAAGGVAMRSICAASASSARPISAKYLCRSDPPTMSPRACPKHFSATSELTPARDNRDRAVLRRS